MATDDRLRLDFISGMGLASVAIGELAARLGVYRVGRTPVPPFCPQPAGLNRKPDQ